MFMLFNGPRFSLVHVMSLAPLEQDVVVLLFAWRASSFALLHRVTGNNPPLHSRLPTISHITEMIMVQGNPPRGGSFRSNSKRDLGSTEEQVRQLIRDGDNVQAVVEAFAVASVAPKKLDELMEMAIRYDRLAMAVYLLKQGATVKSLHLASSARMVTLLVQAGADVNKVNRFVGGITPLHSAQNVQVLVEMLRHGADASVCDKAGNTPLHLFAFTGKLEMVQELIKHGAKINVHNKIGFTPLHCAVERGWVECARVLHQAGADPRAFTADGETAISMAAGLRKTKPPTDWSFLSHSLHMAKAKSVAPLDATAKSTRVPTRAHSITNFHKLADSSASSLDEIALRNLAKDSLNDSSRSLHSTRSLKSFKQVSFADPVRKQRANLVPSRTTSLADIVSALSTEKGAVPEEKEPLTESSKAAMITLAQSSSNESSMSSLLDDGTREKEDGSFPTLPLATASDDKHTSSDAKLPESTKKIPTSSPREASAQSAKMAAPVRPPKSKNSKKSTPAAASAVDQLPKEASKSFSIKLTTQSQKEVALLPTGKDHDSVFSTGNLTELTDTSTPPSVPPSIPTRIQRLEQLFEADSQSPECFMARIQRLEIALHGQAGSGGLLKRLHKLEDAVFAE